MIGKCLKRNALLLSVLAALSFQLQAGGPLVVDDSGNVFRWDVGNPIPFSIDQGSLGILTEGESLALVRDSMQKWIDVENAEIEFLEGPRLGQNITSENYIEFFGLGQEEQELRAENPVIFDDDGQIIEDYLGEGSSDSVLGFAGVRFMDEQEREFLSAWVVINGSSINNSSDHALAGRVITHELGHLLGLDHSQGLPENFSAGEWRQHVPLMYPIVSPVGPAGPIHDDETWLSWLYPTDDFAEQVGTGTIRGRVARPSGDPLPGANVIARRMDGGELSRTDITSVSSGFLKLEQGEFELPGLPPGEYAVCIEPLEESFTGGSGVGPYDSRPVNFPRDYFDFAESSSEDPEQMQLVTVSPGDTRDALLLISNDTTRSPDSIGDDDEILYQFPGDFSFPFYGKTYRSVFVSSDGILSFGIGDRPDGSPRSEDRFLGGPPRIAPLYTDLDPSVFSGRVLIEEGASGESLTFEWDQVPEFSFPAVFEGNTFSVTLYRDGNIAISYEEINITPDPSSEFLSGLGAIVGITPGGGEAATQADLSENPVYTASDNRPIYQVFPGSSLDLEGLELSFDASESRLLFPLIRANGQEFTGFALTSFGSESAFFDFEARNFEGELLPGLASNPLQYQLESGTQFARLSREIFGASFENLDDLSGSWMRIVSRQPEVGSFAQIGNGLGVRQSRMDGAVAFSGASRELYFTRIYQGSSAYPVQSGLSAVAAETIISIVNPNQSATQVVFSLYDSSGNLVSPEVPVTLDPLGVYQRALDEIFELSGQVLDGGYLKAVSSGGGIVGFQLIDVGDTFIGLNAAIPVTNRILYSAQLAHHQTIFTSVKVVNPTDKEISFLMTAYLVSDENGIEEVSSPRRVLLPNQSYQENVDQVFGLTAEPGRIIVGSIKVVAGGFGLVGDVVFGDPFAASYAAALPLQERLFKRAVQSHISNGRYPGDSSQDAFTGLAVFNPGVIETTLDITAYDRDGLIIGTEQKEIEPGGRFSRTLVELIPETAGVAGGFVLIESSFPVVAQQLFGNQVLDYLSAVPPMIIE